MNNKYIEKKVVEIIQKIKDVKEDNILNLHISNFSSLEFVELIVAIEECFSIQFNEEDLLLDKYMIVENIVEKIEEYL